MSFAERQKTAELERKVAELEARLAVLEATAQKPKKAA
jgi:BMFP domain-containing protein YqiC